MSPKLFFLSLLFLSLVSSQSPVQSLQDAKDVLLALQKQKAEIQDEIKRFNENQESIKKIITASVLEDLKWNGVELGNRWKVQEEGTGSYEALVFRDATTTNSGIDRRYAMFKERYTDK